MPEHFLALVKQEANLTSNSEAQRSIKAVLDCMQNTIDSRLMGGINNILPEYLRSKDKRFFAQRNVKLKSFNQEIFYNRLTITLGLTDESEAKSRFSAFFKALSIVQPGIETKLASFLPSDLNIYTQE